MKALIKKMARKEYLGRIVLSFILYALQIKLNSTAREHGTFEKRLKERNLTVQLKLKDNTCGRYYRVKDGIVTSKKGIFNAPDITILFENIRVALDVLLPPRDFLSTINAMKSFQIGLEGPEELTSWWMETLSIMLNEGIEYGTDIGSGVKRYTSNTNGGPVFVYVKNGKIIRITPIEFDEKDPEPWTIKARGKMFTPPKKTTIAPYTQVFKSMIYSPDRILYPMKRIDFDPQGERNPKM